MIKVSWLVGAAKRQGESTTKITMPNSSKITRPNWVSYDISWHVRPSYKDKPVEESWDNLLKIISYERSGVRGGLPIRQEFWNLMYDVGIETIHQNHLSALMADELLDKAVALIITERSIDAFQ